MFNQYTTETIREALRHTKDEAAAELLRCELARREPAEVLAAIPASGDR